MYNLNMKNILDLVIIGSGPAGLTSAIYAARGNLNTLIITGEELGGKLIKTYKIENYPGFKEIMGADLANNFIDHTKNFNVPFKEGNVKEIIDNKEYKTIVLENDEKIETKAIIVASGTKENKLNLKDSDLFTGKGISYCAVCDGFFYRKKDVVVIGGGNSALEEALFLSQLVNKIYIVIRRDVFRADKEIVNKVTSNEKIEILTNYLPESLLIENDSIVGLNIKSTKDDSIKTINCSGIFPYIGASPNTNFLDFKILDDKGYILTNEDMSTSINGIYAAGDVIKKDLRQVVTATSDGAIAANSVIKYLNK